jgi:hypothetical protein
MKVDWRTAALAAISEGFCPYSHGRLEADGWCPHCSDCGAWWSIKDGETVVSRYPINVEPVDGPCIFCGRTDDHDHPIVCDDCGLPWRDGHDCGADLS